MDKFNLEPGTLVVAAWNDSAFAIIIGPVSPNDPINKNMYFHNHNPAIFNYYNVYWLDLQHEGCLYIDDIASTL